MGAVGEARISDDVCCQWKLFYMILPINMDEESSEILFSLFFQCCISFPCHIVDNIISETIGLFL